MWELLRKPLCTATPCTGSDEKMGHKSICACCMHVFQMICVKACSPSHYWGWKLYQPAILHFLDFFCQHSFFMELHCPLTWAWKVNFVVIGKQFFFVAVTKGIYDEPSVGKNFIASVVLRFTVLTLTPPVQNPFISPPPHLHELDSTSMWPQIAN